MDLVKILDAAIGRLPEGDHSQGLKAVKRHIAAAIRHFDREDSGDLDSFTDAIYRTNQAFEGGLKEAYRVLTGKDPAKLSPFQIETYLEENKLIRPRALKQLTRYREDYRNPSVHDYKLDFDADEALLAIVSVCAFSKLLVNQISGKLAFKAGSSLPPSGETKNFKTQDEFARFLAVLIMGILPSLPDLENVDSDALNGFVDGAINKNGIKTLPVFDNSGDDDERPWDNVASQGGFSVPIECRVLQTCAVTRSLEYIEETLDRLQQSLGLLVLVDRASADSFQTYVRDVHGGQRVYVVTQKIVRRNMTAPDRRILRDLVPLGD